ncbi:uncharacterized protein LOC129808908 [Phlebotomus papatasi]|uniref:uncharacterized protein LOC129808908 n=1 Tax=Phlebotomus papatasi TaxID=29031 RepID=UPI0024834F44|nr:uncharacterized protein LOC129808908 [Phlebotomus papatasi]
MSLSEHISLAFTEDKLKEILRKEGNYKLKGYQLVDGFSKKGDSYLSEVFRLRIDGEEPGSCSSTCLNFVVKGLPKNIGRRKTFRSAAFFKNEITFYEDIIPAFEDFQARRSPKKPFIEYPRCYSSFCDGNHDYVALDDLSKYGFVSADRQNGMDFEHCRLALESLGRLHALSLAMKDQEPENFAKLSQKVEETYYISSLKAWYSDFMKTQIVVAKDALAKEYPGTEIEKKALKFISDDLYDNLCEITHAESPLAVIGHGDGWTPNFLFKYDASSAGAGSKVPKEIRIIDFQLARCATLAIDISFFIYSCTTQKLREKHYDDLLKAYHSSCCRLLEDLGSKPEIFPYSALQEEMRKFARFGVGMGIESVPFSVIPESDAFDLDSIQGDDAIPLQEIWVLKPIPTKEGRLRVADMFKHAVDMGYLE